VEWQPGDKCSFRVLPDVTQTGPLSCSNYPLISRRRRFTELHASENTCSAVVHLASQRTLARSIALDLERMPPGTVAGVTGPQLPPGTGRKRNQKMNFGKKIR